jgi:hypothetical protein
MNTCPCSFCHKSTEAQSIDAHLELMPGEIFQRGLHYSAVPLGRFHRREPHEHYG